MTKKEKGAAADTTTPERNEPNELNPIRQSLRRQRDFLSLPALLEHALERFIEIFEKYGGEKFQVSFEVGGELKIQLTSRVCLPFKRRQRNH